MRVLGFVPDWPGSKQHALSTAEIIEQCCPVKILSDPTHYFNQQWHTAKHEFLDRGYGNKSSALCWTMADVWPPTDFNGMFDTGCRILSRGDVGWYAPDVEWTGYIYDREELKPLEREPDVYEVPNTDSLCCMIRGDVVAAMPEINFQTSFMWGMDFVALATARRLGLKAVRDYRYKALHPNETHYDIIYAGESMKRLYVTLDQPTQKEVKFLMEETDRLRKLVLPPPQLPSGSRPLSQLEKNQIESARRHKEHKIQEFAR